MQACARTPVGQECSASAPKLEVVLWSWGSILREGNTQGIHIHPYANISGVYYVAASPASPYAQPRRLRRAFSRLCLHHSCSYYR
jgi:hypothetical protein